MSRVISGGKPAAAAKGGKPAAKKADDDDDVDLFGDDDVSSTFEKGGGGGEKLGLTPLRLLLAACCECRLMTHPALHDFNARQDDAAAKPALSRAEQIAKAKADKEAKACSQYTCMQDTYVCIHTHRRS